LLREGGGAARPGSSRKNPTMLNEPLEQRRSVGILGRIGRYVRLAALVAVAACAVIGAVVILRWKPLQWSSIQQTTIQFLKREDLMFLVTDRVATRVDVIVREGNIILGWRDSVLIGTAKFLCGINLKRLAPEDIRQEDGRLIVTVPDPEVLDCSVDLNSLVLFEKKTGLVAIKEYLENRDTRDELQKQLETRARAFVTEQDLLPKRDVLVKRLNDWVSPLLSDQVKVAVEFR
jgi:hypothetical protein